MVQSGVVGVVLCIYSSFFMPTGFSENGTDCGTVVVQPGVGVVLCIYSSFFIPTGFSENGTDCSTVVVQSSVVGVVLCIQFVPYTHRIL